MMWWWITGILLGLIWLWRVLDAAFGMPKVPDLARPEFDAQPQSTPKVTIVVPARNEEAHLEPALSSLLQLDYPDYEVIAVDDRSSDGTGPMMEQVAAAHRSHPELRVLHVSELPPGWLGKPHAMWLAAAQARGKWLLFTDADVTFRPDVLRRAMAYAEKTGADHMVIFPSMTGWSTGKKIVLAGFNVLFVFGHRAWKVADPKARDHLGVGAFNLVRREAYQAAGTFEALRMEVIEDMRLGKLVKDSGAAQRCAFGTDMITLRWGEGARGVIDNLTKNFFALVHFSVPRAIGACVLLLFLNLLPFVGVILAPGWAKLGFAGALLGIFCMYLGMYIRAPIAPWYFIFHPLSTAALVYTMLRSMVHVLRHDGIVWRDTKYSLEELRRGLIRG
ncbi:MAG TPA: glycosyltransferase [Terriglobales bacterium]|nr:glycosyltransferase [Terriglobales bacterium]